MNTNDINKALQEYEDNTYHNSKQFNISDKTMITSMEALEFVKNSFTIVNNLKTCAIDMDGVILDLSSATKKYFPTYEPNNVLTYDFNRTLPVQLYPKHFKANDKFNNIGVDCNDIFKLFNSENYFYSCLFYGADFKDYYIKTKIIEKITELNKHMNVIIYTQCFNEEVANVKLNELKLCKELNGWTNVTFHIVVGSEKFALTSVDYIIEDSLENLNKYNLYRTKGYLVNQPYNQEIYNPNFTYVFNNTCRRQNAVECIDDILNNLYENTIHK